MVLTATEFKAKCLSLIDQVHAGGEPVIIAERGRVVENSLAHRHLARSRRFGKSSRVPLDTTSIRSNLP